VGSRRYPALCIDGRCAKGALIALHGCEPGEAFARLVDESQRRNIKVRDVALEMLARLKVSL